MVWYGRYDTDMNGYIDVKEFERQVEKKNPELLNHVSGMFNSADANRDRKVRSPCISLMPTGIARLVHITTGCVVWC